MAMTTLFSPADSAIKPIITPADLPQYVPGEIWLDAVDGRWSNLSIRGYKYMGSCSSGSSCRSRRGNWTIRSREPQRGVGGFVNDEGAKVRIMEPRTETEGRMQEVG